MGLKWEMPSALGDPLGEQNEGRRGEAVAGLLGEELVGDLGSRERALFAGIEGWMPLICVFTEHRWAAGSQADLRGTREEAGREDSGLALGC